MRKLIAFMSLLLCLLTGMFSTPAYSIVGASTTGVISEVQNLADETNPEDLQWLVIDDYAFTHLNTAKSSPTSYDPFGNSTYLFNLPFELSSEYEVTQVEIDYKTCSKWFLGIVGGICTAHAFVDGAVLDRQQTLNYYQGTWSTGLGYKLFDYETYPITQLGLTTDLITTSQSIGALHQTADYTDYLAYQTGTESTYGLLEQYDYYFSLYTNINWNTVIIRVQFKQIATGQVVDVPCGVDGVGCEVIGDPEPTIPEFPQNIIAWLGGSTLGISNIFLVIGGIVLLTFFMNVLKLLFAIPRTIWWVIKMLFKLVRIIGHVVKKTIVFVLKFIKWIIIKNWQLLGFVLRLIARLYVKITHYFARRSQRKYLRNRGG